MTNEIPVSMFLFFLSIQFVLLLYSLAINRDGERIDYMITCAISGVLGWLNANMVLNENVNEITSTGTFVPIQSLPLHYFLLAVAIISFIILVWFVFDFIQKRIEKDKIMSALDGDF